MMQSADQICDRIPVKYAFACVNVVKMDLFVQVHKEAGNLTITPFTVVSYTFTAYCILEI